AITVLQQRNREQHRQLGRGGTFHASAERELIEPDLVARRELAILDLVVDLDRQLAFLDAVAGVLLRIRRERRKVYIARFGGEVELQLLCERIHRAAHVDRGGAVDSAGQLDIARLRGRQSRNSTSYVGEMRRVIGLHEKVGVLNVSVRNLY